jgi:hypothetical protein
MIQFGLEANMFPWHLAQGNNYRAAAALAGRPPTTTNITKKPFCRGGGTSFTRPWRSAADGVVVFDGIGSAVRETRARELWLAKH